MKKKLLYKIPNKRDWFKLLKHMPTERVTLNADGSYNTSKAPDFRKWLKNG